MADSNVSPIPARPLPDRITITQSELSVLMNEFRPSTLEQIKEQSGVELSFIQEEGSDAQKFRLFAWLWLRAHGYPAVHWDELDVMVKLVPAESPDPTGGTPDGSSPSSATGGG